MPNAAGLVAVLAAFWLVLSGHYTALLLTVGAASIALVVWISQRMEIVDDEQPIRLTLSLPRYVAWLAVQMLVAAVRVARLVWLPRPALRPVVGRVPANDMSHLAQTIYANSITVTPGTLAMTVDDESIEVHSLQAAGLEDLRRGAMLGRVRRLESR
ncbi:MAG TPA: Na+/H+ antiporter subunit E [Jiangellaceae bacterium]|jgi:multicomponent Na+:H+ antiporter subunit E